MIKLKYKIIIFLLIIISIVQSISIECPDCYIDNCSCKASCKSGYLEVHNDNKCSFPAEEIRNMLINFTATIHPQKTGNFYVIALCDNMEQSNCEMIEVNEIKPTSTTSTVQTTTTTIPKQEVNIISKLFEMIFSFAKIFRF